MTASDLNPTEREVLEQMLAGKRSKDIAAALGISRHAVDLRQMRLRRRIGVRTLLQLGAWCERHGIREAGARV